jgi:hypothetical protein
MEKWLIPFPIKQIKIRESDEKMLEYCQHIIDHQERYEPDRVFEAKNILQYTMLSADVLKEW